MSSQGTAGERWKRRVISIPTVIALFVAFSVLLLPLLVLGAVVDAVRSTLRGKPWVVVRSLLFGWVYLLAEMVGILRVAGIVLTSPTAAMRRARVYKLQFWWADFLLGAVGTLFDLEFRVTGEEAILPGPAIFLVRHASIVDTLIPLSVVRPYGLVLRYVLKRELLADPALDLAGHLIPNYFVARGAADSEAEIARVGALGEGLDSGEGVVIYPEGTRFTPSKQKRFRKKLAESSPRLAERAARLQYTLPPRPGGPLALLDAAPDADVVIIAHYGLDGFAEVKDMWHGTVLGRPVDIRVWRIPRSEIPDDPVARTEWLFDTWQEVDDWIGVVRETSAG